MSLIGKILNQRFYILKSLAQGGFGHTYLAEDRKFQGHHRCVVKHLDPIEKNIPYLDKIKKSFEKEADTLAKLSLHTNLIPKLIDQFVEAGELYLVQEFIDGAPLSAELTSGQKLTEVATIELLIQILTPLDYCHVEGLIHRDLKPDNIMRRRLTGEIVLIDFGLVKDMSADIITKHSYGGSPGYAPHEQYPHGQPEPASDVYAAGMIAIQALTGIYPTDLKRNPNTMELDLHKYCNITDEFTKVLNKMVEFFAIRRYQNARDALAAIRDISTISQSNFGSRVVSTLPIVSGVDTASTRIIPPTEELIYVGDIDIASLVVQKNSRWKILWIPGIIILLILGALINNTFIVPGLTSPGNTSIYENTKYNLKLNYPSNWKNILLGEVGEIVEFTDSKSGSTRTIPAKIRVEISPSNTKNDSIEKLIKSQTYGVKESSIDRQGFTPDIKNQKAYSFIYRGEGNNANIKYLQTFFHTNESAYIITFSSDIIDFNESSRVMNEVTSSIEIGTQSK